MVAAALDRDIVLVEKESKESVNPTSMQEVLSLLNQYLGKVNERPIEFDHKEVIKWIKQFREEYNTDGNASFIELLDITDQGIQRSVVDKGNYKAILSWTLLRHWILCNKPKLSSTKAHDLTMLNHRLRQKWG